MRPLIFREPTNPAILEEDTHSPIEVVSTTLRVTIPNDFKNNSLASRLVRKIRNDLDASDAVVGTTRDNKVILEFTLPNTVPDKSNLTAIRNEVESIVNDILKGNP